MRCAAHRRRKAPHSPLRRLRIRLHFCLFLDKQAQADLQPPDLMMVTRRFNISLKGHVMVRIKSGKTAKIGLNRTKTFRWFCAHRPDGVHSVVRFFLLGFLFCYQIRFLANNGSRCCSDVKLTELAHDEEALEHGILRSHKRSRQKTSTRQTLEISAGYESSFAQVQRSPRWATRAVSIC